MNSWASKVPLLVNNPLANAGNARGVGGRGRSPRVGNGNQLQYSCLENSMDRGAWQVTVCGVAKSRTPLSMPIHMLCGAVKIRIFQDI